jgi:hypothetical protein
VLLFSAQLVACGCSQRGRTERYDTGETVAAEVVGDSVPEESEPGDVADFPPPLDPIWTDRIDQCADASVDTPPERYLVPVQE